MEKKWQDGRELQRESQLPYHVILKASETPINNEELIFYLLQEHNHVHQVKDDNHTWRKSQHTF